MENIDNDLKQKLYDLLFNYDDKYLKMYLITIICLFLFLIWLVSYSYEHLYIGIVNILQRYKDEEITDDIINSIITDMENLYNTYYKNNEFMHRLYPCIIDVFNNIHVAVNSNNIFLFIDKKTIKKYEENYLLFKEVYSFLQKKYKYNEFDGRQINILKQINENEEQLLEEIKTEFLIENKDNSKNKFYNLISIAIGLLGIILSLFSLLVS